ncbi:MAG TPA: hemolysin III family protein [Stellaceae bacterium]|nr:hemolysin III family protein [Stellaceae bacterium]
MNPPGAPPPSSTDAPAVGRAPPPAVIPGNVPFRGYFRPEDIAADRWVHLAALVLCTGGIPLLLALAGRSPNPAVFGACLAYVLTLVVQFGCSTAFYHLPMRIERRRLRQLDHAAIFLLIAGTYTPFTATLPHGAEAVAVTGLIWFAAVAGAVYKLARPLPFPGFSTGGYLFVGATAVIGLGPVLEAADAVTALLIVGGLAIYALGATIRVRRQLRYRNTIWHSMVIGGALCHYAAVLHGVVLRGG